MANRKLIKGGWVVSGDPALGDIVGGDVLIDGSQIAEIARGISADDAEVIDAVGMLVIPGFVDTHRHTWQSCLRHTCGDISPLAYFDIMLERRGRRYRPEDVYVGNLIGALTALDGGVTTMLDWSHVQNSPEHSDAAIAGLKDTGVRAIFAHGGGRVPPADGGRASALPHSADVRRIRREVLSSDDALVTLAIGGRGPELADDGVWQADLAMARDLGLRTTIHMGAFAFNGAKAAISQVHREGLLGPDLTFVHCCTCADDEIRMMADHGVSASLGVQVEQNMEGLGEIPIDRLLAVGIEPSLSCDTETAGAGDMFTLMRMALGYYRSRGEGRRAAGAPEMLKTRDVFRFATQTGADANGLGHRVGSLTPGKAADIVLIRRDDINLGPVSDPVGAIVMGAHSGNVDTVLVNGRVLKKNGKLIDVDFERIKRVGEESQEYILSGDAESASEEKFRW